MGGVGSEGLWGGVGKWVRRFVGALGQTLAWVAWVVRDPKILVWVAWIEIFAWVGWVHKSLTWVAWVEILVWVVCLAWIKKVTWVNVLPFNHTLYKKDASFIEHDITVPTKFSKLYSFSLSYLLYFVLL